MAFGRAQGEVLLDAASKTTPAVAAEYAHITEGTWSSKGMLELIRHKMSATALLDSDDKPSTSTSSPLGKPLKSTCTSSPDCMVAGMPARAYLAQDVCRRAAGLQ